MKISIFGLGYVGAVTTACLAQEGHYVIGVDPNQTKVKIINSGQSPIIEKDLEPMIVRGVKAGRIRATTDSKEAVLNSDVSLICVGTPSNGNGSLNVGYIESVSQEIGVALKEKDDYHIVVVRSTMLPGTIENTIIPILERESCKRTDVDFGVAINPEFLRESTSVYDFYNPPKTVIGAIKESDVDIVAQLYNGINAPLILGNLSTYKQASLTKFSFI